MSVNNLRVDQPAPFGPVPSQRQLEWHNSVRKGCCLLLNIPPDQRGPFHEADVERLLELRAVLDQTFASDLVQGRPATATNERGKIHRFSAAHVTDGETIGACRILRVPTIKTDRPRLMITGALACPTISSLEVYLATTEADAGGV
jgi:hypothetical protein